MEINEIDVIKLKLSRSNNIFQVIEACKDWRVVLLRKCRIKLRPYQVPLSNKIIECVISGGALGNELVSLWSRQCLVGETIVNDEEGNIGPIKELGFYTGEKEVYEYRFTNGLKLQGTLDHKFKTNNGWKTGQELKNELEAKKYWRQSLVFLGKLKEGNLALDDDKVKILAYMITDGSYRNSKQSFKFTNTNYRLLKEFEDSVKSAFNIYVKKYSKGKRGWDYLCTTPSHATNSNPLRNWFKTFKWVNGLPSIITELNNSSLSLLINRMVSADGCVAIAPNGNNGSVDIALEPQQADLIAFLLMRLGVYAYTKKQGIIKRVCVTGTENLKQFFSKVGLIFGKEKRSKELLRILNRSSRRWRKKSISRARVKEIKYIGVKPTFDQTIKDVHEYVANGLRVHNSGKTETVADTVLTLGLFFIVFLKQEFNAGLFAPVESMITHVTRNRLRKRFKTVKKWLARTCHVRQVAGEGVTSSLFILENKATDKEFSCRSLSVGERAEIIGESFQLLIIEQSELVNAMKLKNDVFPMGAETGGVRVLTGTTSPYFKNEYFRAAVTKWSEDPKKNRSTADYVEILRWKEAAKSSVSYRRYVSREKKRMGIDSVEFRTQFGLEWVETITKFIAWEKLINQEVDYVSDKERLRFFGIDVARAGDSTVVTVIEINGSEIHILGWLELQGLDFETQIPRIIKFLRQYKPLRYGLVDKPGMGVALFDMLKKRLWDEVEVKDKKGTHYEKVAWARIDGYYGSAKENDKMFKSMDREFQHDRVYFDKHTKYKREKARFIDQLLDVERKYLGYMLKLQAPKIKGRHDDYPFSLALAIYAFKEKSFQSGVSYFDW